MAEYKRRDQASRLDKTIENVKAVKQHQLQVQVSAEDSSRADDNAAELLLDLSVFGYSQLSDSDQREKMEAIRKEFQSVMDQQLPEESDDDFKLRTFRELFKKLPFPDQNMFLSRIIKIFKRERKFGELVYWFSQLDANDQQKVMGKIVHVADQETDEDTRVRRFTQICGDYTEYVYRLLGSCEDIKKHIDVSGSSDWLLVQSRFCDFISGFMTIWWKTQAAHDQRMQIESLSERVEELTGTVTIEKLTDERDEDFRLRKFSELCKNAHFDIQVDIIRNIKKKLLTLGGPKRAEEGCGNPSLPDELPLRPKSASELLSILSTFGFSLLPATDQQEEIDRYKYNEVLRFLGEKNHFETFRLLFYMAGMRDRIRSFKRIVRKFYGQRQLCESIVMFRQQSSDDQQELLKKKIYELMRKGKDAQDAIVERIPEESEQDFRLRRFIMNFNPTYMDRFSKYDAEEWARKGVRHTSDNDEIHKRTQSRYVEFYLGVSTIWFRERCANSKNPIEVLFGRVEDDKTEKLSEDSREEFRLKRFTESFEKLPFTSQELVVEYIRDTLKRDLIGNEAKSIFKPSSFRDQPTGRGPFDHEFIRMKLPFQGETATSQGGGTGASTQAGGSSTQGGGSSAQGGGGASTQGDQGSGVVNNSTL